MALYGDSEAAVAKQCVKVPFAVTLSAFNSHCGGTTHMTRRFRKI